MKCQSNFSCPHSWTSYLGFNAHRGDKLASFWIMCEPKRPSKPLTLDHLMQTRGIEWVWTDAPQQALRWLSLACKNFVTLECGIYGVLSSEWALTTLWGIRRNTRPHGVKCPFQVLPEALCCLDMSPIISCGPPDLAVLRRSDSSS